MRGVTEDGDGNRPAETFHERLRRAMTEQMLSGRQLAAMTGLSDTLIFRYRMDTGPVPRDYFGRPNPNAYKLAKALGMTVEELLPAAGPGWWGT